MARRAMKTAVLISCAAQKLPYKASAQDRYIGPLFRKSFQYARLLKPHHIFTPAMNMVYTDYVILGP
jgi:hypothetical protein